MTQDAVDPTDAESRTESRAEDLVWWATWAGLLAGAVGVVDGIVMALRRRVVPCPNGTEFGRGETDFRCFQHPQAGLGIGIAVLSLMVAIILVLVSITARSALRRDAG